MRRLILLLAAAAILAACGDDDPYRPPVTSRPAITSISLSAWALLTDSVVVSVEATDADTVCLRAGAQFIACDGQAPFEFDWDTKLFTNGPHLVDIQARNAAGTDDSTFVVLVENPGRGVGVAIRPASAVVALGDTVQYTAIVVGTADTRVVWSLQVPGGSAAGGAHGHLTSDGLYTAPFEMPFPATAVIRATSVADPAMFAVAAASLIEAAAVEVTPDSTEVRVGRTRAFSARVHGLESQAVVWSVDEGAAYGTITADGIYTAPGSAPVPAVATVRAACAGDPQRSGTARARILEEITVTVTPAEAQVVAGRTLQFNAEVGNTSDGRVSWSVEGGPSHGLITDGGLYTTPVVVPDPPLARVVARSRADSTKSDTAEVSIVSLPPLAGEADVLSDLSWAGFRVAQLSHQAADVAAEALCRAQRLNGGVVALDGVLRQSGDPVSYGEGWIFEPGLPGSGLRVVPAAGVELDVQATSFIGGPYGWVLNQRFNFHGSYECRLVMGGGVDLQISHTSWRPDPLSGAAMMCEVVRFARTIVGHATLGDLGDWQIDISHRGETWDCSGGWSVLDSLEGRVTTTAAAIELDESINRHWGGDWGLGGRGSSGWSWSQDDVATTSTASYRFAGVLMRGWYYLYSWYARGTVEYPHWWTAGGTLLRDGHPYGAIRFSGPVAEGAAPGPDAILEYGSGQMLTLRGRDLTAVGPEVIIPNPFRP